MKWVLVDATLAVVRECQAGSLAEARVRLRPIPSGHAVLTESQLHESRRLQVTPSPTPRRPGQVQSGSKPKPSPLIHLPGFGRGHPGDAYTRWFVLSGNVRGLSDRQIAAGLGVSAARVEQIRRRLGLPNFHERRAMAVRAYHGLGWHDRRIAQRVGMHPQHVCKLRQRLGLPANTTRGAQRKGRPALATDYCLTDPYRETPTNG